MSFRISNKVRNAFLALMALSFLLAPLAALASSYAMVSIRPDWWYQQYQTTRNWGTSYTTGGLLFGTPPTSALPVTPSGSCPVVTASTPCTASWGTGPVGLGTTWSTLRTCALKTHHVQVRLLSGTLMCQTSRLKCTVIIYDLMYVGRLALQSLHES